MAESVFTKDLKWALEIAVGALRHPRANWDIKAGREAADMIEYGSPWIGKELLVPSGKKVTCEGRSFEGPGVLRFERREVLETNVEYRNCGFREVE